MSTILFKNARIVDGTSAEVDQLADVLIVDKIIQEKGKNISSDAADVIDLKGKTLMPGLIDCHVHIISALADLGKNAELPDSLVMARSLVRMRNMLMRGFTTVRDTGGTDAGLIQVTREGVFPTPRVITSGKALSQTGGHADLRGVYNNEPVPSGRVPLGRIGHICDGIREVRVAARQELKGGADFIKIMANGGCASPTDPIHFLGYSREEILAIVEEAEKAGTYVSAHLYTDEAIRRCVECGVHSLEHCNLIEKETAEMAAAANAFAVPTLVAYEMLATEGVAKGFPEESLAKVDIVRQGGLKSLEIMRDAGLVMAYGSDLLGDLEWAQSEEFLIRGRVLTALEVIQSATVNAAKLLRMEGLVGCVEPNSYADLIVVDGDPLSDLSVLTQQGRYMPIIMKGGQFIKREQGF